MINEPSDEQPTVGPGGVTATEAKEVVSTTDDDSNEESTSEESFDGDAERGSVAQLFGMFVNISEGVAKTPSGQSTASVCFRFKTLEGTTVELITPAKGLEEVERVVRRLRKRAQRKGR